MGRGDGQKGMTVAPARRGAKRGPEQGSLTVALSEQHEIELEPGLLDARAVTAFSGGQCHALAIALAEQTGWPLCGIVDSDGDFIHFYVRSPDGRALDISGAHSEDEMLEEWGGEIEELDPADARCVHHDGAMRAPDLAAAASFVAPVLEYADGRRRNFLDAPSADTDHAPRRRATQMLVATDREGGTQPLRAGELDDAARSLLRNHQDHALARLLAYACEPRAGLGMLFDENHEVTHCYGVLEDGRAFDVDGLHTIEELQARYGGEPWEGNFSAFGANAAESGRPAADDAAVGTLLPVLLAEHPEAGLQTKLK